MKICLPFECFDTQVKIINRYFPVVLFILLYKVAKKTIESGCAVQVSCGAVYCAVQRVVVTFDSVDEIQKWDHSNGTY